MKTQAKNTAKTATAKAAANGARVQNNAKAPEMTVVKPDAKATEQAGNAMSVELARPGAKAELRASLKGQRNLESTKEIVTGLHRRIVHINNLEKTIENLKKFKVTQLEEGEEEKYHTYSGCVLTIRDDQRNEFSTSNPALIQFIVDQTRNKCEERRAELEAEIVLPDA